MSQQHVDKNENAIYELEELPLGRNDYCFCGSGKKYKKCCLGKNVPPTRKLRLETLTITSEPLTPEEAQANYPVLTKEDKELQSDLYHQLHFEPETIDSEDCAFFRKLHALRLKYPDYPVFLNYISSGYEILGRTDKVAEIIDETFEKFPNYLFARTAKATAYLKKGLPEKALEVLGNGYTLKQLYPNRSVFHISELRAFNFFMVRYFCHIKNPEHADIYLETLSDILEEDDPMLEESRLLIVTSKLELYTSKMKN